MKTAGWTGEATFQSQVALESTSNTGKQAVANPFVQFVLTFWCIGVALWGKEFCYLHIGPLYITEAVLGLLIVNNISRLTTFDYLFFGLCLFYVIGGLYKGFPLFFVGKDLSIFYNVLFLRFFPMNLNSAYQKVIVIAAGVGLALGVSEIVIEEKYKFAILLFFFGAIMQIKGFVKASPLMMLFYTIFGILINFKTVIALALLLPFLNFEKLRRLFLSRGFLILPLLGLMFLYALSTEAVLNSLVGIINFSVQSLGFNFNFAPNTAIWRSLIWKGAIARLYTDGQIFFGTFPGHNFMDASYLRSDIMLFGGDSLGVVRTGHNALIQLYMKTGLIGVIFYFKYFLLSFPKNLGPHVAGFVLMVLICALSADILEVPSRGPLFFCLLHILHNIEATHRIKNRQTFLWDSPKSLSVRF